MKRRQMNSFIGSALLAVCLILTGIAPANAQDELLRWKLKTGQQFDIELTQSMTQTMTGGPQDIEMPMEMKFSMSWTVDRAEGDIFRIIQTIDRVQMQVTSPFMNVAIDTDSKEQPTGVAAQLQQTIEPLVGAEIKQTMDSRGKITDVEFPEGALKGFAGNPMTQQFSEDGIKQMFAQSSVVFPESQVQKGSSWNDEFENDSPMGKMKLENIYRYEGVNDVEGKSLDKIHVSIKMTLPDEGVATLKGQDSSGYLYFDNEAGYITGSKINQKLEFEIAAGGQQLNQTITGEIEMKIVPKKRDN